MATPRSSLITERELRRLLEDVQRIREWSSNLPDLSAYIANAMARSAIERELMDIGVILHDAAQRADALGRQIDPQTVSGWYGLRVLLAHHRPVTDHATVWRILTRELDDLARAVSLILPRQSEP